MIQFDADQYRSGGWKSAVEQQYTHYERLGLDPHGHVSAADVGAAHRARANWWRQRGAQAQGGKNNPLIAEISPFIKTAEENLQKAFDVLNDVDRKAAYDRELDAAGAQAGEEKFREFIRFTLDDSFLTPTEKNSLFNQARQLGMLRERAEELIREEMQRTGATEIDDPSGSTPRQQSATPIVTGSDHPRLALSHTTWSLGTLRRGQVCAQTFTIDNTGGSVLEGAIDVSHPEWMKVSQAQIDPRRHHQEITVQIDTAQLALGTNYVGMVEVRSNGGRQGVRIDFSIELQDDALSRFRKQAFWLGFLGGAVFGLLLYALIPDAPTANTMARVAGNLAVIAFVVVGAMAGKWGGGIGGFFFAAFSEEILRNLSMPAYSAGAWGVLTSAFLYVFARRLLVATLAGDRRTRTWIVAGGAGVATAVILGGLGVALNTKPQPPATKQLDASSRTIAAALVGQWRGTVGNSPATLDITQQGTTQNLTGRFAYQGVVEEVGVTIKNEGNVFQLLLPGKAYRRVSGTGSFALDTFSGPLAGDGLSISGSYVDTSGRRGRWAVKKVQGGISGSTDTTPDSNDASSAPAVSSTPAEGGTISVEAATYGLSCNVTRGNYTANLARLCNGRGSCTYRVNNSRPGGDPAQGCNKDYIAQYRCSGDAANLRVARHPAEKNENYAIVLDCLAADAGGGLRSQTEGQVTNDPGTAAASDVSIRVEGDRQWTDSGIMLRTGDMVSASADGEITVTTESHVPHVPPMSPVGYRPDCTAAVSSGLLSNNFHPFPAFQLPCWSLIGRVGPQGPVFELGRQSKFQAATHGELYLGVNDENVGDNAGSWMVSLTVNNLRSALVPPSSEVTEIPEGGVYKPGGDITNPIPIYRPEPQYSEEARKAKLGGTVQLSLIVDETGHTTDIKVLKSLGFGLDEKAVEAVSKWRFKPGTKGGKPVKVAATIDVTFRQL